MTVQLTGSKITGTTLTVGSIKSGQVQIGLVLSGTGILANTVIVANISGSGAGSTWTVNQTQTVAATDITGEFITQETALAASNLALAMTDQEFNTAYSTVVANIVTSTAQGFYRTQVELAELAYNQVRLYLGERGYRVVSNRDGAASSDTRTVTITWNLA
jgi:hypothetical protein